jgi:hypothetical protein
VSDAPHKARLSGSGHIHHRRRGAGVAPRGVSAATLALEISSRNARVAALQKRWDRLRAGRDLIVDERGADMVQVHHITRLWASPVMIASRKALAASVGFHASL